MSQTMREAIEEYGRTMYSAGMDAASWDRRRDAVGKEREAAEMLDAILSAPSSEQAQQGAESEDVARFAIKVEKLLCEKLGIPWTVTGISIVSLVDHLASRPAAAAQEKPQPSEDTDYVLVECLRHGEPRLQHFDFCGLCAFCGEVLKPAAAAPARKKCTCTYATAANTPAVRSGHEMGGYVKAEDPQCPIHGKATLLGSTTLPIPATAGAAQGAEPVTQALRRLANAVDLHLGRTNQTTHLKGYSYSQDVRKELFAAHDAAMEVLKTSGNRSTS